MKTRFLALGLALMACAAPAAGPLYTQMSGNGNATAGAEVIFPSDGLNRIHLVSVNWNSDSNAAVLSLTTGAGLYKVAVTNAATTSTTNQVNSTNGLVAGSILVVERAGVAYAATMSSFNSNATWGNYVVLASGGWGVLTATNDPVYQMSSAITLPIGATTNHMQGDSLYVGAQGRPVRVVLTPAAVTNKLNAVVARYGGGVGSVTNMELTVVEGGGVTNNQVLPGSVTIRTNLLVDATGSATISATNVLEVRTIANLKALEVSTNGNTYLTKDGVDLSLRSATLPVEYHTTLRQNFSAANSFSLLNTAGGGEGEIIGRWNDVVVLGKGLGTMVTTPNIFIATNGLGSYSVTSTNNIAATGITNTSTWNRTAIVTATAAAIQVKNHEGTIIYNSPTLTETITIPLQPGGAVTAASGLSGTLLPY